MLTTFIYLGCIESNIGGLNEELTFRTGIIF